jgi:diguanylate cyclase (GGDEF)-like protein
MFKIKDIMVSTVVTVSKGTAVSDVIRKLIDGGFSGLPVVNKKKKVVGIITELDILKSATEKTDFSSMKASDIMTETPLMVDIDTPVFDAMRILIGRNIHRLPVTSSGKLVGVLSRRDILRGFLTEAAESDDIMFITEATKALFSAKTHRGLLEVLVAKLGDYFEAERCSVISIDENQESAVVLSTYEDSSINNLEIDLSRYPEILKAFNTGEPVLLDDADKDPMMSSVRHWIKNIDLKSIMVFPIISNDEVLGTLYFRTRTKRDFSHKDVKLMEILSEMAADALRAMTREKRLLDLYKDSEKKVVIDDLTGLYNRRFFDVRLSEEFGMSRRHATPLSCIMFDLDNFKQINDTLGHHVGDEVLKRFASILKNSVRISDIVARYAGDEFIMLLPMSDADGALREAERIKQVLDDMDYGDDVGDISVSIGVACYPCPKVKKAEDLVKNADSAMYIAKKSGKNQVVIHSTA